MKTVKELIFFSSGSADDASTWSNIPYLFSRELERQGLLVHKVNLSNRFVARIWESCIRRPLKLLLKPFHTESVYYGYSRLSHWLAEKRIKQAVNHWPTADYCIFIGYQHANRYSKIPSLLLSDWTTDVTISLKNLPPKPYRDCIKREHEAIRKADYVVSIFQLQAEKMQREIPDARVRFLGGNVINSFDDGVLNAHELIEIKRNSRKVLFIGRKTSYMEAARILVEAVVKLHEADPRVDLEMIGIAEEDFDQSLPDYVHCHGFLHKDIEEERSLYYKLLREASVLVNVMPKWAAYSSTVEAMYFYTPIVVSPYQEFVHEFGENIPFGRYNSDYSVKGVSDDVLAVLSESHYEDMCIEAHLAVESYTWENYVRRVLNLIEGKK